MSTNGTPGPVSGTGADEHCEPKELMGRLAAVLRGGPGDVETAAPVLLQLFETLSHRFERENDDFDAAIQRAPWLTAGVIHLRLQHGKMLQIIGDLRLRLQDSAVSARWSGDIDEQLDQLVLLYHEHATAECRLLQESCNEPEWTLDE